MQTDMKMCIRDRCMSEGRIACVFYYAAEEDEDYKEINGKWLNEEPYGVVHRLSLIHI